MAAIWFSKGGSLGFWTAFFLILAATFILQLDEQPKLRQFHLSVNILQWILLGTGLVLLFFLFSKQKETTVKLINQSLIFDDEVQGYIIVARSFEAVQAVKEQLSFLFISFSVVILIASILLLVFLVGIPILRERQRQAQAN